MDISSTFTYTSHCAPQVSENGQYIAYVTGDRLVVRSSATLATKRIINLPFGFGRRVVAARWDKCIKDSSEQRLALASNEEVLTFSIDASIGEDQSTWGTVLPGKEGIADVEWKSCRYQEDKQMVRLIVFSRNSIKMTVWSSDGKELEVWSPKAPRSLAKGEQDISCLTRETTTDVVRTFCMGYLTQDYSSSQCQSVTLNGLLDAQNVKWSLSGLYLAAAESPVMGCNVQVYGSDGTLLGEFTHNNSDHGITCMAWSEPCGKEMLLIGSQDETVRAISVLNFRPQFELHHGEVNDNVAVWIEAESNETSKLVYARAWNPFYPPQVVTPSTEAFIRGVSLMNVSPNGRYVATKTESMPATVWVWDLKGIPELITILSHSSVIHTLQWSLQNTLLVVPSEGALIGNWNPESTQPLLTDLCASMQYITGATWSGARICAWDGNSFIVVSSGESNPEEEPIGPASKVPVKQETENREEYEEIEEQDVTILRQGSPQMLQDDDTRVRDIVNGVQQTEWVTEIQMEDTFHGLSIKSQ